MPIDMPPAPEKRGSPGAFALRPTRPRRAQKLQTFLSLLLSHARPVLTMTSSVLCRPRCRRALSPSSSPRSTACTLTSSARRKLPDTIVFHPSINVAAERFSLSFSRRNFVSPAVVALQGDLRHAHRAAHHAGVLHPAGAVIDRGSRRRRRQRLWRSQPATPEEEKGTSGRAAATSVRAGDMDTDGLMEEEVS